MTSARRYRTVAETLRTMLGRGRWAIGERLPPERTLAEELEVPRSTVREALIVLEVSGLVEVRHASGIYVKETEIGESSPHRLSQDLSPFEMLRARQVVESAIAAAAALTVTDRQLLQMEEALDRESRDIAAGRGSYEGDALFHRLLGEATQNAALVAVLDQLWSMRQSSQLWQRLHNRIFQSDYRLGWARDHEDILTALRNRDPESARAATWRHLGHVSQTLMDISDPENSADPEG